jgi:hypothetical protein
MSSKQVLLSVIGFWGSAIVLWSQNTQVTAIRAGKSDTPRGAGGLMSWAVSKTADPWV